MRSVSAFRVVSCALLALLLATSLAACGGGKSATSTPATSASPTSAAATATINASPTSAAGSPSASATSGSTAGATTTAAPSASAPADQSAGTFAYGWNVAVRGDDTGADFNQQVIDAVNASGFGWVRFQLQWRSFERQPEQWDPLPTDRIVDALSSQGIKVLIVVAKPPDWAIDPSGAHLLKDFGDFQRLMAFLSDRYKGKVQAWELWNEENLAGEMGGMVRIDDYVNMLRAGSAGVRAGDPSAKVVFGGLTPNGVNDPNIAIDDVQYLQEIYAYNNGEIKNYFDIMGAHVSSTHNPPDTMWPDNPGPDGWNDDASFYFRRAEQLREVMTQNGDDAKPMWITEFGWTTANQAPGYEYGQDNSEQEVADYLTRSFEIMRTEWDFVTGAFVWNLNWSTLAPPEDEKSPWSALNADWSPRPAYDALKAMPKE